MHSLAVYFSGSVHPHTCGEIHLSDLGDLSCNRFIPTRVGKFTCTAWRCTSAGRFIPTRVGKLMASTGSCCSSAVHPHACGEIAVLRARLSDPNRFIPTRVEKLLEGNEDTYMGDGSSPHVWGNFPASLPVLGTCRFIPTRVGKLSSAAWRCRGCSVHPHTCGEIPNLRFRARRCLGSSPHVWGNFRRLQEAVENLDGSSPHVWGNCP